MKTVSQATMTFATGNVADETQTKGDFRGIPSVQVGIFSVSATITRAAAQVSIRSWHHILDDAGEDQCNFR